MQKKNKKNILDFGCGHGYNTYILSKKYNAFGVDLKDNIDFCKNKYPNIDFRESINNKIDFPDGFFDKIFAIEVLEHVDNIETTINELNRVLGANGELIVSIPYLKSEEFLLKIRPTYFDEIHHVRIFMEGDLEKMLEDKFLFVKKNRRNFLSHLEIIYLFKGNNKEKKQTSIGNWRDTFFGVFLHIILAFFSIDVFKTPLKFIPIWVITLPVGVIIDSVGNIFFPKSIYYKFIKKK